MPYYPAFNEFAALAREHTVVPVYRQLVGDTLTPVSAFCKLQEGEWSFLFESVVGGERVGRYSFVGSGPFLRFQAWGNRVRIDGAPGAPGQETEHADPIKLLGEYLARYNAPHLSGLPRFCGGAVGYAAYDAVRYTERLAHPPPDDRNLPDLCFAFHDRMVIFDHINKTIAVVAHAHSPPDSLGREPPASALTQSYQRACQRVDQMVERLQQNVADLQLTDIAPAGEVSLQWRSNIDQASFEAAVAKAKEYIYAGDIFQVVLSQRLQTETRARTFDIYRTLR